MTIAEKPPEPVIDEYNTVLSRPCLRAVAYLSSDDRARERLGAFVALMQGPLRALVTVCSGTHLRPKERRHRIGPKDFDALGAVLEPRAHYAGFMLFGDAMLDAAPFALPMFRLAREPDGFTVELAFRPDVDVDWVTGAVWPVLRDLAPDYAYLGWGVLPYIAGHEHGRRVTARHKARYRAAACLDATMMTKIVLDEEAARRHAADADEPTDLGIADLGWKTVLGSRFASRIDLDALAASGAALVRQPDGGVEITLGERPTWGDVNTGSDRDASARRRALAALRPIRASKAMMLRWSGLDDTPEAADIVEAYFAEWPSANAGDE